MFDNTALYRYMMHHDNEERFSTFISHRCFRFLGILGLKVQGFRSFAFGYNMKQPKRFRFPSPVSNILVTNRDELVGSFGR